MDWLSRAEVLLLAVMLVDTAIIVCQRLDRYRLAARQSRAFVRDAAGGLQDAKFDEVIRIASRNTYSHVAAIVAAGLTAFISSPPSLTSREAIESSERAMHRAQKMTAAELSVGLGTLATVASSAPFIGLLGTCFGIIAAFRGYGMEKSTAMAMVTSFLSEALITTVMGLLVAVPALWCHNYLRSRMYGIQTEMTNAALETLTYLETRSSFRDQVEGWAAPDVSLGSGVTHGLPLGCWEAPYDRQRVLLVPMWCSALCLAYVLIVGLYRSYRWRASSDSAKFEYIAGQELVSPDHRYRALVPPIYRGEANSPRDHRSTNVDCQPNPVAVTVVPNDRPLAWKPYACGQETKYALETGDAILISTCDVPVIAWRTSRELLVECDACFESVLRQVEDISLGNRITVLGADGKRIQPIRVIPQHVCNP